MTNILQGPYYMYLEKLILCDSSEMDKSLGHFDFRLRISHWNPMRPSDEQIMNGYVDLVNSTIDDEKWVRVALGLSSFVGVTSCVFGD